MKNNKLIIGDREAGKTTYLFNLIPTFLKDNGIIVLDSATDHVEKSLLHKVVNEYPNSLILETKKEEDIAMFKIDISSFIKNYQNYFPYAEIIANEDKIICFDLSYFLEMGYNVYEVSNNILDFRYYRSLYNLLSEQIIVSLILMARDKKISRKIVLMDEIELPITKYDISSIQSNISFIASIHLENSFGTFYHSFEDFEMRQRILKRKED